MKKRSPILPATIAGEVAGVETHFFWSVMSRACCTSNDLSSRRYSCSYFRAHFPHLYYERDETSTLSGIVTVKCDDVCESSQIRSHECVNIDFD